MSRLLVLSAGPLGEVRSFQADLAEPLALALGWSWNGLWAGLEPSDLPNEQLALLQAQPESGSAAAGAGELVGLPLDPGLLLPSGGHWAEALGAWRQPVLLVLSAAQCQSGLPAAMTALLMQWQVPLVGLVQWGEPWEPELRRADGLPWLGNGPAESLRSAFGLALRSRLD
ncbi:hypothetical protein [Cyanobium sp. WAJ14-Wanaka]|uniref:hypothetical protein n=1 Tax=Cyanobium sp. WAJ14-Wanaka TaxID=2823725 RepID=UPI0020CCC2E1|nr:hypothetical protein [Cyanobium sp. WAJ14-Wanaka]MCP9774224.1 hypothetical protein [Cyanobium sp. WAJ14-Wanaka]